MMKERTIDDIKKDYSENILNCALINLLQIGKTNFDKSNLREQASCVNEVYDNLDLAGKRLPITREFALQVLDCEYKLFDFDDMELLTYFSKNKKMEDEEE